MISSLRLVDFRCFETAALDLNAEMIFFTGNNAQGKTSVLEAIAVACRLQSPRAGKLSQLVRFENSGCGVAFKMEDTVYKAVLKENKFQLSKDGFEQRRKDYLFETPRIVWMENRDIELIRGSGEKRRKYLDFVGGQYLTEYASALRNYTKALRSRNALLKTGVSQGTQIEAFEKVLIDSGQKLITWRGELLQRLQPFISESHQSISGKQEHLEIQYRPSTLSLQEALEEGRARDAVMKQTLTGPHRDDFTININAQVASDYASEGQQRTIAIALKLAQGRLLHNKRNTRNTLIYLIDDVFGELDENRRNALLSTLPEGCQKILTTTSLEWNHAEKPMIYEVKEAFCSVINP